MLDADGLTPKQKAWADEYIKSGNAREAARKAGYKYPNQSAIDNAGKRSVKAYIAARMAPTEARRVADADEVLDFLSRTMRGEIKDQFGLDASLQDRIKAAQELMKRYAVADMRQQSTLQRLDDIFISFRAALDAPPTAPQAEAGATAPPPQHTAPETTAPATEAGPQLQP